MPEFLRPVAKAVAAALTPLIVTAIAKGFAWIGADVPVDPQWVESAIIAVVTAVVVWAVKNAPDYRKLVKAIWEDQD